MASYNASLVKKAERIFNRLLHNQYCINIYNPLYGSWWYLFDYENKTYLIVFFNPTIIPCVSPRIYSFTPTPKELWEIKESKIPLRHCEVVTLISTLNHEEESAFYPKELAFIIFNYLKKNKTKCLIKNTEGEIIASFCPETK